MRRIVIDTNVVLAGLLWRGPPHLLLTQVGQNPGMQLFNSQALLDELADVLTRPSPTKRLNQINLTAHAVLADYVRAVTVLQPPPLPQPVCRDPDDDEVLQTSMDALVGMEDLKDSTLALNPRLHTLYKQMDTLSDEDQQALFVLMDSLVKRSNMTKLLAATA